MSWNFLFSFRNISYHWIIILFRKQLFFAMQHHCCVVFEDSDSYDFDSSAYPLDLSALVQVRKLVTTILSMQTRNLCGIVLLGCPSLFLLSSSSVCFLSFLFFSFPIVHTFIPHNRSVVRWICPAMKVHICSLLNVQISNCNWFRLSQTVFSWFLLGEPELLLNAYNPETQRKHFSSFFS